MLTLALVVSPGTAALLGHAVRRLAELGELDALGADARLSLSVAGNDLDRAGRQARPVALTVAPQPMAGATPAGSAAPAPTGAVDGVSTITTREAAEILGLTQQAIRKSAASRGGEFVNGQWRFPRDQILAERDRKAG